MASHGVETPRYGIEACPGLVTRAIGGCALATPLLVIADGRRSPPQPGGWSANCLLGLEQGPWTARYSEPNETGAPGAGVVCGIAIHAASLSEA
jgi:hypothetical protein